MKKPFVLFAVLAAGALSAHAAGAQVFGQYSGARPIATDTRLFGAYAGFTNSESELVTQLRLSFYPNVDFGFQGGLSRVSVSDNNRTAVKLGADFKALVAKCGGALPFDLSLGGSLGVSSAEDFNLLGLGPQLTVSRTFGSSPHARFTAYAGALLVFTRSDLNNENNTDVSMPLRFGGEFEPNAAVRLVAELQVATSDQINDDLKMSLGASFPF